VTVRPNYAKKNQEQCGVLLYETFFTGYASSVTKSHQFKKYKEHCFVKSWIIIKKYLPLNIERYVAGKTLYLSVYKPLKADKNADKSKGIEPENSSRVFSGLLLIESKE